MPEISVGAARKATPISSPSQSIAIVKSPAAHRRFAIDSTTAIEFYLNKTYKRYMQYFLWRMAASGED